MLEVEITPATQYATVYRDGRPVATMQRRGVYEKGPFWRLFDTTGRELFAFTKPFAHLSAKAQAGFIRKVLENADA